MSLNEQEALNYIKSIDDLIIKYALYREEYISEFAHLLSSNIDTYTKGIVRDNIDNLHTLVSSVIQQEDYLKNFINAVVKNIKGLNESKATDILKDTDFINFDEVRGNFHRLMSVFTDDITSIIINSYYANTKALKLTPFPETYTSDELALKVYYIHMMSEHFKDYLGDVYRRYNIKEQKNAVEEIKKGINNELSLKNGLHFLDDYFMIRKVGEGLYSFIDAYDSFLDLIANLAVTMNNINITFKNGFKFANKTMIPSVGTLDLSKIDVTKYLYAIKKRSSSLKHSSDNAIFYTNIEEAKRLENTGITSWNIANFISTAIDFYVIQKYLNNNPAAYIFYNSMSPKFKNACTENYRKEIYVYNYIENLPVNKRVLYFKHNEFNASYPSPRITIEYYISEVCRDLDITEFQWKDVCNYILTIIRNNSIYKLNKDTIKTIGVVNRSAESSKGKIDRIYRIIPDNIEVDVLNSGFLLTLNKALNVLSKAKITFNLTSTVDYGETFSKFIYNSITGVWGKVNKKDDVDIIKKLLNIEEIVLQPKSSFKISLLNHLKIPEVTEEINNGFIECRIENKTPDAVKEKLKEYKSNVDLISKRGERRDIQNKLIKNLNNTINNKIAVSSEGNFKYGNGCVRIKKLQGKGINIKSNFDILNTNQATGIKSEEVYQIEIDLGNYIQNILKKYNLQVLLDNPSEFKEFCKCMTNDDSYLQSFRKNLTEFLYKYNRDYSSEKTGFVSHTYINKKQSIYEMSELVGNLMYDFINSDDKRQLGKYFNSCIRKVVSRCFKRICGKSDSVAKDIVDNFIIEKFSELCQSTDSLYLEQIEKLDASYDKENDLEKFNPVKKYINPKDVNVGVYSSLIYKELEDE